MATYKTPNIDLHKWAETDYFKRTEINSNFEKLDSEIKDKADKIDDLLGKQGDLATLQTTNKTSLVNAINEKHNEINALETNTNILTAITSNPPRIGQIAVVGGIAYIATGTASTADWKQITN